MLTWNAFKHIPSHGFHRMLPVVFGNRGFILWCEGFAPGEFGILWSQFQPDPGVL